MSPLGGVVKLALEPQAARYVGDLREFWLRLPRCGGCWSSMILPPYFFIGADGLALTSYQDATNMDLKVAHCSSLDCS